MANGIDQANIGNRIMQLNPRGDGRDQIRRHGRLTNDPQPFAFVAVDFVGIANHIETVQVFDDPSHFDVSGFAGAYWSAHGGELDATRLTATVAAVARASGVVFRPAPVRSLEAGRRGAVVETDEGSVRAAQAVVATDVVARDLVPELGASLCPAAPERLRLVVEEGVRLPTAARTADGRLAWQCRGGKLTLAATGGAPPDEEPAGRSGPRAMAARLPGVAGGESGWAEPTEVAVDGLPVVGRLPGRPLAVACGFGALAASFSFGAAVWVADALFGDRDPTPRVLLAGRERPSPGRFEPGPA